MTVDILLTKLAANSHLIGSLISLSIIWWFIKKSVIHFKNRNPTAMSPVELSHKEPEPKPNPDIELERIRAFKIEPMTGDQLKDKDYGPFVCCPCCGYKTIQSTYDICEVCWWECDGLEFNYPDDHVIGGPNSDYSLAEAKSNFERFGTMYRESDIKHKELLTSAVPSDSRNSRAHDMKVMAKSPLLNKIGYTREVEFRLEA